MESILTGKTVADFLSIREHLSKFADKIETFCPLYFNGGIFTLKNAQDFPQYNILLSLSFCLKDQADKETLDKQISLAPDEIMPETSFNYILDLMNRTKVGETISTSSDEPTLVYVNSESKLIRKVESGKPTIYTIIINAFAVDAESCDQFVRRSISPENINEILGRTFNDKRVGRKEG